MVGDGGADGHLDPLQGIQHQEPKLPVEAMDAQDIIEGRSRPELMPVCAGALVLERKHVGGQTVEADEFEVVARQVRIRNDQPSRFKLGQQPGDRLRGFCKGLLMYGFHKRIY